MLGFCVKVVDMLGHRVNVKIRVKLDGRRMEA
jgi:uncharacterized Fe-S cluster-containing radical SAM superfamily protein